MTKTVSSSPSPAQGMFNLLTSLAAILTIMGSINDKVVVFATGMENPQVQGHGARSSSIFRSTRP